VKRRFRLVIAFAAAHVADDLFILLNTTAAITFVAGKSPIMIADFDFPLRPVACSIARKTRLLAWGDICHRQSPAT
jgi:hypothetical protein